MIRAAEVPWRNRGRRSFMGANFFANPPRVPGFVTRLAFQATGLGLLGPLWLAAFVTWARHIKNGDAGFAWWLIYLAVPIPLTLWGLVFLRTFGPRVVRPGAGPGARLLFAIGLLGASPPAVLLVIGLLATPF